MIHLPSDTVVSKSHSIVTMSMSIGHLLRSVSTDRDRKRLNKLFERASSVLNCHLESIEEVGAVSHLSAHV